MFERKVTRVSDNPQGWLSFLNEKKRALKLRQKICLRRPYTYDYETKRLILLDLEDVNSTVFEDWTDERRVSWYFQNSVKMWFDTTPRTEFGNLIKNVLGRIFYEMSNESAAQASARMKKKLIQIAPSRALRDSLCGERILLAIKNGDDRELLQVCYEVHKVTGGLTRAHGSVFHEVLGNALDGFDTSRMDVSLPAEGLKDLYTEISTRQQRLDTLHEQIGNKKPSLRTVTENNWSDIYKTAQRKLADSKQMVRYSRLNSEGKTLTPDQKKAKIWYERVLIRLNEVVPKTEYDNNMLGIMRGLVDDMKDRDINILHFIRDCISILRILRAVDMVPRLAEDQQNISLGLLSSLRQHDQNVHHVCRDVYENVTGGLSLARGSRLHKTLGRGLFSWNSKFRFGVLLDNIKAQQGIPTSLDTRIVDSTKELAELNLSKKQLQNLVDFQARQIDHLQDRVETLTQQVTTVGQALRPRSPSRGTAILAVGAVGSLPRRPSAQSLSASPTSHASDDPTGGCRIVRTLSTPPVYSDRGSSLTMFPQAVQLSPIPSSGTNSGAMSPAPSDPVSPRPFSSHLPVTDAGPNSTTGPNPTAGAAGLGLPGPR